VLPMSALKLSNPVIFSVGMVADNLSFHVNVIARARAPVPDPSWGGGAFVCRERFLVHDHSRLRFSR
jgi:hypothetical protein